MVGEEYGGKLQIGGGKERMASLLTPGVRGGRRAARGSRGQQAALATWHKRKTAIYTEMVAAGGCRRAPASAGSSRAAQDAGWKLGVASTSAEASVHAILDYAVGADRAGRFDVFLAGDCVPHKKPAPDIYLLALETARRPARRRARRRGLAQRPEAATAAGLRCLVTVNGYTEKEDFSEATLVVSSLGDPDGEQASVIANRSAARPSAFVTLADIEACLAP